jgi:hypothetical protein
MIKRYDSLYPSGTGMKEHQYGDYVKYFDYDNLENAHRWLIHHAWLTGSISKAKAAELLGVPLIDFDAEISKV